MPSKAPFRVRIRRVRYCSHRYRIAALRQYTARPAKPRKLTTRQGSGDLVTAHSNHSAHHQTSSVRPSENSPTFGSPARLNATAPTAGSRDTPDRGGFALALLSFTWRGTVLGPDELESNVIGYGHGGPPQQSAHRPCVIFSFFWLGRLSNLATSDA
jgi:hypothetical protein